MKILIIGFLALFGWSALSTHFYVCRIKGFCHEPATAVSNVVKPEIAIPHDSLSKPIVVEQKAVPESMLIYFAFDKSEFNSGTISDRYLNESNKYLDQNLQAKLSITGHTDAIGSDEYNQALGLRRAQSVQLYFESKGIPANRIIVESRGKKEPADNNSTTAGRANNRRTVITIKH
ncbi:MAG: OmpA family protein [Bacteroidales bacterium]|jgi:outer membrane protein OmpA-like peptidoglycan-associated protein